jgi:hypothetical protein
VISEHLFEKVCTLKRVSVFLVLIKQCSSQFPNARIAVTHDDDWCALIENVRILGSNGCHFSHSFAKADEKLLDDNELLLRLHRKYIPVLESGMYHNFMESLRSLCSLRYCTIVPSGNTDGKFSGHQLYHSQSDSHLTSRCTATDIPTANI